MSDSENEVYAFCKQCKENIRLVVSEEDLEATTSGLIAVLSVHGSPQHALLAYLDKNLRVRGIEYPAAVQIKDTPEVSVVDESAVEDIVESQEEVSLRSLVDFFGKKQKDAVGTLSRLVIHAMIKKPIFLVHEDKSLGAVVKSSLMGLLTEQTELIEVIDHEVLERTDEEGAFAFDLQMMKTVKEGIKVDPKHIESIIKDALAGENPYFRLKYELSKLFFSYGRLTDQLRSTKKKLLDRELAHDVAIDFSLLSTLLAMAEGEGIDAKSLVEKDGLGTAIRSI